MIVIGGLGSDFDVYSDKLSVKEYSDLFGYPSPVKGLIVTYADDGLILDLFYPEGETNPLMDFSNVRHFFEEDFSRNSVQATNHNLEGYLCTVSSQLASWGSYPNKLYNCTQVLPICPSSHFDLNKNSTTFEISANCTSTQLLRIGVGRATTFSDPIGQANITLKKGDVATKLSYDNVAVGKILHVRTKTKSGTEKTVLMTKNDAGGMPNAVLDIWKTGVEYWGYSWSSTFSMPNKVTYMYYR